MPNGMGWGVDKPGAQEAREILMTRYPIEKIFTDNAGPCYLVAEISANHNGSIERAERLVRAAAESGADAIKLQTYTPDTITLPFENEFFSIAKGPWKGRILHELYEEAHMPWEWQPRLKALANDLGMDCFSTAFDATSVDFLESIGMPCHKIASFEAVDIPLLEKVASTGKPVILSTGMASLAEIDEAVSVLRGHGAGGLLLLKCVSAYPAPVEECNLRTIPNMAQTFQCAAGLSDHTMGDVTAIAAAVLGARLIEKHFTISRSDGGPDGAFSMEAGEFAEMARRIRIAEKSLGKVRYGATENQQVNREARRSLFICKDIKKGECFTAENIRSVRPGNGLHTRNYSMLMRKRAARDLKAGQPLGMGDIIF